MLPIFSNVINYNYITDIVPAFSVSASSLSLSTRSSSSRSPALSCSVVERSLCIDNFSDSICIATTAGRQQLIESFIVRTDLKSCVYCNYSLHSRSHRPPSGWRPRYLFTVSNSGRFLANVNSRSRSLYAIARPSVVCLSVCNVRASYSGGSNFRRYFYGIWYPSHPLTSTENFTEIVPGKPLRRGS